MPTLLPFLRHCPVTATVITLSALASAAEHQFLSGGIVAAIGGGARFANRKASYLGFLIDVAFPFGFFSNMMTAVCTIVLLFHFRHLERRHSSPRFFMMCLLPSGFACVAARLVAAACAPTSAEAVYLRVFSGTWVALLTALAARYWSEVPSLGKSKFFGSFVISDKIWSALVLGKLVLLDAFLVEGCPKGLLPYQLAMAAIGAVSWWATSRRGPLLRGITVLDHSNIFRTCSNLASTLLLGGPSPFTVRHAIIPRDQEAVQADVELARALRESMAGGAAAAAARATPPAAAARRAPFPHGGGPSPATGTQPEEQVVIAVDKASVDLLVEMGLGCTRAQAEAALRQSNGDVDLAATLLLDSR